MQEQGTELFVGFGSDKIHYYSMLKVALPVKVMSEVLLQLCFLHADNFLKYSPSLVIFSYLMLAQGQIVFSKFQLKLFICFILLKD